jgi:PhnB protein
MTYKPDGYSSASPYLMVRNARATIDFAKAVFDAEELRNFPDPDGGVMHAEIRIDDTVIMMGEVGEGETAHIHVYVPDVRRSFAAALATGASVVQEVTDKGDGDLRGGVSDSNGIVWWIATQKEAM